MQNSTFQVNLTDNSIYEWNCLACDIDNNCNFSLSNFTFKINTSYIPLSFYQYPTVSFYNETTEIILFEANKAVNGTIEYDTTQNYGNILNLPEFSTVHEFNITGLTPGTKYYYRINIINISGEEKYFDSFNSSFVTANDSLTSFTFAVVGDMRAQSGTGVQADIFSKLISYIIEKKPDFVINVGDATDTNDMATDEEDYNTARAAWKEYTDVMWNSTDHIPTFIAIGNHEEPDVPQALKRYREVVLHPLNGNGSNTCNGPCWNETTYWFRYGNSLFISLNTEENGSNYVNRIVGNQLTWLNKTINMTDFTHKFVFAHKPFQGTNKSGTVSGSYPANKEQLENIFQTNNLTAAFYGHNHYNHYYCKNTTANGLLHIITGGGGAPLDSLADCFGSQMYNKTYHYIIINITGNIMNGTVYNYSNDVIDKFGRIMD